MDNTSKIKDFKEYCEYITYCNQDNDYDALSGEWFYCDDIEKIIYYGSFGNDNSPGSKYYTFYRKYDSFNEYLTNKKEWESLPEYLDSYVSY